MIEPTAEMVKLAVKKFVDAPGVTIREIDAAMHDALAAVFALLEQDLVAPATVPDAITVTVSAHDLRAVLAYGNGHAHMRTATWDRNGLPCNECLALGRLALAVQLATGVTNAYPSGTAE